MIHLICALHCEARPLIEYHGLTHITGSDHFKCYTTADGGMSLTVSGIGKTNAAAAVSHTCTLFNSPPSNAWLNIGVAGHASLDIGRAVLAHGIEDAGSGLRWYPQLVFAPPCPTMELRTLERPSTDYAETVIDMEAAGFYSVACRCSTAELVQVLKIISDNTLHPAGKPDADLIAGLIRGQLQCINGVIGSLLSQSAELAALLASPAHFNECVDRWHFTHYERNTLLRLLQYRQLLCPRRAPLAGLRRIKTGKELLRYLKNELKHARSGLAV